MEWVLYIAAIVGIVGVFLFVSGIAAHRRKRTFVGVVLCMIAIAVAVGHWRPSDASPTAAAAHRPDAGASKSPDCPIAAEECTAFHAACDALRDHPALDTVEARWLAVERTMAPILGSQPWIRDRYGFTLRPFHAAMAACGIDGSQSLGILTAMHAAPQTSRTLVDLLTQERRAICMDAWVSMAAATGVPGPWSNADAARWEGACFKLLASRPQDLLRDAVGANAPLVASPLAASPATGGTPAVTAVSPPDAADGAPSMDTCPELRMVAQQRDRMVTARLSDAEWLAYGRALATCPPGKQPWTVLRLSGGRGQYFRDYLAPYINGDAVRGELLRTREADTYGRLAVAWEL